MTTRAPRYTTVAILLHWGTAGLILLNLATGLVMEGLSRPLKEVVLPFHFSCGISVLVLTAVRIAWRLWHSPPPRAVSLARWERAAAHISHRLMYVLMVAMPLTGWSIISAHPPRPQGAATIWGMLTMPAISAISRLDDPAQKAAHGLFVELHTIGGWTLIGVLVAHVAGALKHEIHDREPELARMGVDWITRWVSRRARPGK